VVSEVFERRKQLSVYWHNKAFDLLGSAAALWAMMHDPKASEKAGGLGLGSDFSFAIACPPVFLMLCGLAYELMLKAIIVAKGEEPKTIHDLAALSETAGLRLPEEQIALLRILSGSIIWEGKYPVPTKFEHFSDLAELRREHLFDKVPFGKLQVLRPNENLDWPSFLKLWNVATDAYSQHHS